MPSLLGQQLFPADYPWNQNIANAPVASNSAAIIAHIGKTISIHPDLGQDTQAGGNTPLYGIPYNVVHGNSTAKLNVIIDNYPGESDIAAAPIPANAVIEGDFQGGQNNDVSSRGDSHLIVWDEDNNIAYEFYQASRPSENSDGQWHAAQETVWNMNTDSFRNLGWTSADAAGLSVLAGLLRPDEGLPVSEGGQGAINHALRMTLPSGDLDPQYVYPASHVINVSQSSVNLPFGARLRLQNNSTVNHLISLMSSEAQITAHAMQQYGLVVADDGSPMFVTGASYSVDANNNFQLTWNANDILGLESLNAGDFDVVNLTPIVTSLSTSSGAAGSTITIHGQNFSGAAGNLEVLFGAIASPSVNYVSDTQITAVVPYGLGTVNIQVQSGVKETDPNNPAHNVNAPIFGYGVSGTVPADQFTLNGPNISTLSTDSLATNTVEAGDTDLLTIVVKDSNGNSVSGLATASFGFALAGGTSAGVFNAVTETTTKGTYTVNFTGTTVGSATALTVQVNGVALLTKPSVTVSIKPTTTSIGSNSPNPSTTLQAITLTASVTGNVPNGEYITLEDASNGNAVIPAGGNPLSGGAAFIEISAGSLSPGTHDLFAIYSGDGNFASSQSQQLMQIVIAPVGVSGININAGTAPIISASETGNVATFITDGPHGFAAADPVVIANVGNGYNGHYQIVSVSPNSFTVNLGATSGLLTITNTGVAVDTARAGGLLINGTAANGHSASYNSQRSMVDSIVYTFNQAVNLGAGAFTLTGTGSNPGTVPSVSYSSPDGGITWVLTFSGAGVIGNSIANGEYQIVLNSAAVTGVTGGGTLAASDTETFYRLFGDTTGNGHYRVSAPDRNGFNGGFGTTSTSSNFLAYLDWNDDGRVSAPDRNAFNGDFGIVYSGFASTL